MREDIYLAFKRIAAFLVGFSLWGVSIQFSAEGTNFHLTNSMAFGYLLAFSVTVLELIFDEQGFKGSFTLAVLGLGAYAFGMISNYYGIWARQGQPEGFLPNLFSGILAFFIEVTPEQLVLWSLGLTGRGIRDFLSNIFTDGHVAGALSKLGKSKRHDQPPKQPPHSPVNLGGGGGQHQHDKKGKHGGGKWKPGGRGRPPKGEDEKERRREEMFRKILEDSETTTE